MPIAVLAVPTPFRVLIVAVNPPTNDWTVTAPRDRGWQVDPESPVFCAGTVIFT